MYAWLSRWVVVACTAAALAGCIRSGFDGRSAGDGPTGDQDMPGDVDLSDEDFDGIPAWLELQIGLDPTLKDTDGDGLFDYEEVGEDTTNPVDTDGDGIIDALDLDSDNGGEPDRSERLAGRNFRLITDDVAGDTIVVTTADDEDDGGATAMTLLDVGGEFDVSFREALQLSANIPGVQEIHFDSDAFPQSGDPAVIRLSVALGSLPTVGAQGLVIDGAGARVEISGDSDPSIEGLLVTGGPIRIHRLTLRNFGGTLNACLSISATNVLVDSVTLSCEDFGANAVFVESSTNVVLNSVVGSSTGHAVSLNSTDGAAIFNGDLTSSMSNYAVFATGTNDVRISRTILTESQYGAHLENPGPFFLDNNTAQNNGVDGIWLQGGLSADLLGNIVSGNGGAGISFGSGTVVLNENYVTDNGGAGLFDRSGGAPAPPTITSFSGSEVVGSTTAADGAIVQVFLDAADEGGFFLGTGTSSGGSFAISVEPPGQVSGQNLTATVTPPGGQTSVFSAPFAIP